MTEIVVLSGAGLSAESGVGTFRGRGGLWESFDISEVATPDAFARDPAKVHAFYNARRAAMRDATPNAAHHALTRLEAALGDGLMLVTQNIDDLLERAGARRAVHMHGRIDRTLCAFCGDRRLAPGVALSTADACPSCGETGGLRPDVVWFGEVPHALDAIAEALSRARLFVSIGTSGEVYPAAGFVHAANARGTRTLEINLEPSAAPFDERRLGPATETVPAWVDEILEKA